MERAGVPDHSMASTPLIFEVIDTGRGIPPEQRGAIFEPFRQVNDADSQSSGTGLGLSISQTLIQHAGGIITVRNREEGGAAFAIWLPERRD